MTNYKLSEIKETWHWYMIDCIGHADINPEEWETFKTYLESCREERKKCTTAEK